MNKTNVFRFMGESDLVQSWYRFFKKINGKIYDNRFGDEDSSFVGTLTSKHLQDFRSQFLHEGVHLKAFDTYPKDPLAVFRFISDRSVDCGCTEGYWLVRGEWCQCYDCKGKGRRYPEAGIIMLQKDWKPEKQHNKLQTA